jgi:hypothetical protein
MSKKISSYKELLEEKARLEELLLVQREAVKSNYVLLKNEIRPITHGVAMITGVLGKFGRKPKGNPLVNLGLDIGTELLLKRYLLVKAGWLTRTVVPYIVRNFSAKFFADKDAPIWKKVKNMFSKKKD